jgi:hypothetical protein
VATPSIAAFRFALLLALVLTGAAFGCAGMRPPARTSGATFSDDGVQLAVVGQRCSQVPDPKHPRKRLLDATFAIEVGNPTYGTVVVHPSRMILVMPGEVAMRPTVVGAVDVVAVETGITSPFVLRFVAEGISCAQELRLEPNTALELNGQPIVIAPIRFVPGSP